MEKFKSTLVIILFFITGAVFGQTYDDVVTKFNEAADNINKGEFASAITNLQDVLVMGATVGTEADDLVNKSKEQITVANYSLAINYMKQKDYENAIPYLEKTVELADAYNNNQDKKAKAVRYLPQLLVGVGTQHLKNNDTDVALEMFDKAIKYNPNYPKAYLGKGMILKSNYEEGAMLEAFQKAIDLGKAANDQACVMDAQKALGSYYVELGNSELEEIDPAAADYSIIAEYYEKAISYDPMNSDAHFWLAGIANRMEEYEAAIEHAIKALETETLAVKISALNWELGIAYLSQNNPDMDKACEAFKNVTEGDYYEKAQEKMSQYYCQ